MARHAAGIERSRKRAAATGSDEEAEHARGAPARGAANGTSASRIRIASCSRRRRFTKEDVADYYRAVAEWMLPELVGRPLSIVRCPDGADANCFFQKHHAAKLGAHVAAVALKEKDGASDDYLYVRDLAGVLELVQMNALEFHPWGSRVDRPDQPDRLVFDLDPGARRRSGRRSSRRRARCASACAGVGLESFARLSGGKGAARGRADRARYRLERSEGVLRGDCRGDGVAAAAALSRHASKAQREGRIFIDWLRNARGATSVASWSLRARAGAPVAMPLRWDELGRTRSAAAFDLKSAQRRAQRLRADPWAGFTTRAAEVAGVRVA